MWVRAGLLGVCTGCFGHVNPCDPLSDEADSGAVCDDTASSPDDTDTTNDDDPAVGLTVIGDSALDVASPHGMVHDGSRLWIGDWENSQLNALTVTADGSGNELVDTIDLGSLNPRDLAWDGTSLWVLTVTGSFALVDPANPDGLTEQDLGYTNSEGLTHDGEYLCVLRNGDIARVNTDTYNELFTTSFGGVAGPMDFRSGKFVVATASANQTMSLDFYDSIDTNESALLSTLTAPLDVASISGLAIDGDTVYVIGDAPGTDSGRLITMRLE